MRSLLRPFAVVLLVALVGVACVPPAGQGGSPAPGSQPVVGPRESPTAAQVIYRMEGDDWGYPSPFAFYSRGPGYMRMSYLFDTLVWKDENGFIPWLADEWDVSEDGTAWAFRIRKGVRWHDGTPLTAEDVAFSYEYMAEKYAEGMIKWGWPLDCVASAKVTGDGTVVITTTEPRAGLLTDLFGSLPVIPKHIWEGVEDPLQKLDEEAVIGSSLFRLKEYSKEEGRYVYEANEDFFLGKPVVDTLVYVRVNDPALALLAGEVDEVSFSGKGIASVRHLENEDDLAIIEGPSDWVLKLYINTFREPLSELAVRRALAYAIDREEIVEKAQMGGAVVASMGILSPGTYWHHPDLPTYAHDPDRAIRLLREAGVEQLELTLVTTEGYARDAELVRNHLEAVGISVTVRTADRATVDDMHREGNFDLLITGHGGAANPDMDQPSRPTAWVSEEYQEVYRASTLALDDEERREYVWRMQEIVAEELPVIALWHPLMWEVYRLDGVKPFYTPGGVASGIPMATNKLMFLARE